MPVRLRLAAALVGLTLVGCSWSAPGSPPAASPRPRADPLARTFTGSGLSFRYPSTWVARNYHVDSSLTDSIIFVSNQRMHQPCRTRHVPRGVLISCGTPLKRLRPAGVLVSWWSGGGLGRQNHHLPDRLDGQPASIHDGPATEACDDIGATSEVDATSFAGGEPISMYACLAAPADQAHLDVRALLRSVRLASRGPVR
jgi:hypothetical protein